MAENLEKRLKILVIDDDPDTAEILDRMLHIQGHEVVKVFGGGDALMSIFEHKPDAVILDVMMPDLSGLDILRQIRKEGRFSSLPVIIVSALALPLEIQQGFEAGASNYLTKPVSFHDLRSAIEEATSRQSVRAIRR